MSRVLAKPWIWGLLYVGLAPLFAVLYRSMPGQFVQTTLGHEPLRLERQFDAFAGALSRHLSEVAIPPGEFDTATVRLSGYRLQESVLDQDQVYELTGSYSFATDDESRFSNTSLMVEARVLDRGGDTIEVLLVAHDEFPDTIKGFLEAVEFTQEWSVVETTVGPAPYPVPSLHITSFLNTTEGPEPLLLLFRRFTAARDGDPTAAGGDFWRMLYFSIMTLTTVGYGDIAPTTEASRFAVMVEAVSGVVLAGTFLNALGRRYGAGRRGSTARGGRHGDQ